MNRFTMSAVAVVGLALASSAQAGPRMGGGNRSFSPMSHPGSPSSVRSSSHPSNQFQNYHLTHGKKFSGGYFYSGRDHRHWSYCYWDRRYGCYLYWDPCVSNYYYYCAPQTCYYPVSYCPCNTYCWDQPAAPLAPVVTAPTLTTNAVATVNLIGGIAPAPVGGLPPGTPPTQGPQIGTAPR